MSPLVLKSLHIIGVVVWFAGLFYLGRLFVYHAEAEAGPEGTRGAFKAQFALMERRLYFGIAWPGMVATLLAGLGLLHHWGLPGWLHAKLGLVALLVAYHLWCGAIRRRLADGTIAWTSKRYRLFNEAPTLLLVAIVFAVVMKDSLDWAEFALWLAGLVAVIGGTVQALARRRAKRDDRG